MDKSGGSWCPVHSHVFGLLLVWATCQKYKLGLKKKISFTYQFQPAVSATCEVGSRSSASSLHSLQHQQRPRQEFPPVTLYARSEWFCLGVETICFTLICLSARKLFQFLSAPLRLTVEWMNNGAVGRFKEVEQVLDPGVGGSYTCVIRHRRFAGHRMLYVF